MVYAYLHEVRWGGCSYLVLIIYPSSVQIPVVLLLAVEGILMETMPNFLDPMDYSVCCWIKAEANVKASSAGQPSKLHPTMACA